MSLDRQDVEKIAHLARLAVSKSEIEQYSGELSKILDFVDQLNQVNTEAVTPMAHPIEVSQRLRVDEVSEQDQRETYQQCASAVENGLYLVPKVIE